MGAAPKREAMGGGAIDKEDMWVVRRRREMEREKKTRKLGRKFSSANLASRRGCNNRALEVP